jgi:glutamate/tyrosine decarboxylase-like PLP-dependent enzyme
MRNTSSDNFERIAHEAVVALTSTVLTLRITGDEGYQKLADAIAERATELVDRAIALGAV